MVSGYTEAIFSLGSEMLGALKQRSGGKRLRLNVGIADSFRKLIANAILRPAFEVSHPDQGNSRNRDQCSFSISHGLS